MTDTQVVVPVLKHIVVWFGRYARSVHPIEIETVDPAQYQMDPQADHFQFHDVAELDWEHEGRVIKLSSEHHNFSPFYVPGGVFLTAAEREASFGANGPFQHLAGEREQYDLVSTRSRVVALPHNAVELLPSRTTAR